MATPWSYVTRDTFPNTHSALNPGPHSCRNSLLLDPRSFVTQSPINRYIYKSSLFIYLSFDLFHHRCNRNECRCWFFASRTDKTSTLTSCILVTDTWRTWYPAEWNLSKAEAPKTLNGILRLWNVPQFSGHGGARFASQYLRKPEPV